MSKQKYMLSFKGKFTKKQDEVLLIEIQKLFGEITFAMLMFSSKKEVTHLLILLPAERSKGIDFNETIKTNLPEFWGLLKIRAESKIFEAFETLMELGNCYCQFEYNKLRYIKPGELLE